MRRQLPPSHLKVPPGPQAFPRQQFATGLGENTVIVNHYSGFEKAIPSLPGFRTSAGKCVLALFSWSCARLLQLGCVMSTTDMLNILMGE
jgi:hypothetical protein